MTIADFKIGGNYIIMAEDLKTGEVYEATPESAIADIASQFSISNDAALVMLDQQIHTPLDEDIMCPNKNAKFWVERIW